MKKLVFIFFIIVSTSLNSQVFTVGDTSCNYAVLNKFINLSSTGYPSPYSFNKNCSIDLDGDLANDLVFDWTRSGVSMGSSSYNSCTLKCSSTSNYQFVFQTSTVNCGSGSTYLPSNIPLSTPLNASLNWSLTPSNSLVYNYCFGWIACNTWCGHFSPTFSTQQIYLGFRKILTNDTIYGWIKLKISTGGTITSDDEIVSYAFKHTASNNSITPAFTNTNTNACAGMAFSLTANPAGGSFFGTGVTFNTFTSPTTSTGTYVVYYTNGCVNAASLSINVLPQPTVAFTNSVINVCNGSSVTLSGTPPGGVFSGVGITGNIFNSLLTGLGYKYAYYTFTDINGCSNTATAVTAVTEPTINISKNIPVSCPGESVTLVASGASTYTWDSGSNSPSITVQPTVTTSYSVIGTSSLSCDKSAAITVSVSPPQTLTVTSSNSVICAGDTLTLYLAGGNGYIIEGGSIWLMTTSSQEKFVLNTSTNFTITSSCSKTYFTQAVTSCVGIVELNDKENHFQIFPNPNNGEFEIKGLKEETIFISNELGQLISTKNLTQENNYSVKLSDLQSGIYFVGSKFYRQKVVVIK